VQYPPAPYPTAPYPAAGYPPGDQPGPSGGYPGGAYPGGGYPSGGYPADPSQTGYTGQGLAPSRASNGMAVASLVLGILGLTFFFGIASIPAVIVGHIARKQIRERNEDGAGLAIAGLVTGWIGVALVVAVIVFFVVIFGIFGLAAVGNYP
jgi:hypothetical protein